MGFKYIAGKIRDYKLNTVLNTETGEQTAGDLPKAIADVYNLKFIETLTGFKYIGDQIKFFEEQHTYKYVYGMEESFGCLVGDYTRDKDACGAVVMLCEVAVRPSGTELKIKYCFGVNEKSLADAEKKLA